MTSHVRHRRTTVTNGFNALEPGELALNFADWQLLTAQTTVPRPLLAVTFFLDTASYKAGQIVVQDRMIWVAKADLPPGPFSEAQWTKIAAQDVENQVDDAMAAHIADPDPHTQYATDIDLRDSFTVHLSAADPHPQYATDADLNAFKAQSDPFPQYTTDAEVDAKVNAAKLTFTPVQQGGGTNQNTNKVYIGWSQSLGKLLAQVDGNDFSQVWPINADAALGVRHNGDKTQSIIRFAWYDPGGAPAYLWGGNDVANQFLVPPGRLHVGGASNADAVNGISGWAYRNDANNPTYLWATEGNGGAQHLTQPGNLRVEYANNAGWAVNAGNANTLGGADVNYFVNRGGSAVVNIRNNGAYQLIAGISGFGDVWWPVNVSDARIKENLAPSTEDSLAKIDQLEFEQFSFKPLAWNPSESDPENHPLTVRIDDGHLHRIGVVAQKAEQIDAAWVSDTGTYKQLDPSVMLLEAMHAIQQLKREFDAYKAAHP